MNYAPTSFNGYMTVMPKAKTQYEAILKAMEAEKSFTRREIAARTGMETSTVSARVNKLMEEGKIRSMGIKIDPYTGVHVEALEKVVGTLVMF